jgi:hypothetical protein
MQMFVNFEMVMLSYVSGCHRWNRSDFLTTGTGTGLKKSDRTGPAGLPKKPVDR